MHICIFSPTWRINYIKISLFLPSTGNSWGFPGLYLVRKVRFYFSSDNVFFVTATTFWGLLVWDAFTIIGPVHPAGQPTNQMVFNSPCLHMYVKFCVRYFNITKTFSPQKMGKGPPRVEKSAILYFFLILR